MKRLAALLARVIASTFVAGVLVAAFGTIFGFYDWMWPLVIVVAGAGLWIFQQRDEPG